MRWILLILTVVVWVMAVEALRWKLNAREIPFEAISRLWRGGLDHMGAGERRELRQRYGSTVWGMGELIWVMWLLAAALTIATLREFLT